MKRIKISLFVLLLSGLILLSVSAMGEAIVASGDCSFPFDNNAHASWSLTDQGVLTISGEGRTINVFSSDDVEFAEWSEVYPFPWESWRESITKVVIGEQVASIGQHAFENCPNLTKVVILANGFLIDDYAFANCPMLTTVEWDNVTVMQGAFMNCTALKEITIPNYSTYMYNRSWEKSYTGIFQGCTGLETVTFANNCVCIDQGMFEGCTSLQNLIFQGISPQLFERKCFKDCSSLEEITFSDIDFQYDYGIEEKAFSGCTSLREMYFHWYSEDKIASDAFSGVTATAYFENYFTQTLPSGQFGGNITWKKNYVPQSFSEDAGSVHYEFDEADGILRISGFGAVDYEHRQEIWGKVIPYIETLIIENGIVSIPDYAFMSCDSLRTAELPSTLTYIGEGAFRDCVSLTDINIPEGVSYLKDYCFTNCSSLSSITLPDSLDTLGRCTFAGCTGLQSITLPASLTRLYCERLPDPGRDDDGPANLSLDGVFAQNEDASSMICQMDPYDAPLPDVSEVIFQGNRILDWNSEQIFKGISEEAVIRYPGNDGKWVAFIQSLGSDPGRTFVPYGDTRLLTNCHIVLSRTGYVYDGTEKRPGVSATFQGTYLVENTDYSVRYENNVNAGSARAVLTGKGTFSGTATVTFEIAKAEPALSFAELSVEKQSGDAAFVNPLTAVTDGVITYSSNNTDVAEVNSNGRVTIRGAGTAVITANAAEGTNYLSDSVSYSLAVAEKIYSALTLRDLSYKFNNSENSFGYAYPYKIPLSIYEYMFEGFTAKVLWRSQNIWQGNCFGFASSSVLMNHPYGDLSCAEFGASGIGGLSTNSYSSRLGLNITGLIEACQIMQFSSIVKYNWGNDLNRLVEMVKSAKTTRNFPVIAISGSWGGHAIVGYKVVSKRDDTDYLYVYDCNHPNKEQYIILKKDSSGNYKSWYYLVDLGSSKHHNGSSYGDTSIWYYPFSTISSAWNNRGNLTSPLTNAMAISSKNFEIQDYAGNTVAEMQNGRFSSYRNNIYLLRGLDYTPGDSEVIFLPTDVYQIVNSVDGSMIQVEMANQHQMASISTNASSFTVSVIDQSEINDVSINTKEGDYFSVTLESDLASAAGMEKLEFSGEGGNAPVRLGMVGHSLYVANCPDLMMAVNGNVVTAPNDIVNFPFRLEYTVVVCDGTAKTPEVIIEQEYGIVKDKDYIVKYENNTDVGMATVTVYGIDRFTGKQIFTFRIVSTVNDLCPDGHAWDAGKLVSSPTLYEDGSLLYTCTACGTTRTDAVPGLLYLQTGRTSHDITVQLTNNTSVKIDGHYCLAAYNAEGRMTGLVMKTITLDYEDSDEITLPLSTAENPVVLKAFLLERNSYTPIGHEWIMH